MKSHVHTAVFMIGILFLAFSAHGQVAVNTDGSSPDASAMLDVKSTTLGFLAPVCQHPTVMPLAPRLKD